MRVFLAGAAGAIGVPLCHLLRAEGHAIIGTARSPERAAGLRSLGVEATVVDVFEAAALAGAVAAAKADVVMHQLTDLPPALDPARMPEYVVRNARIRSEGTAHLVAAARAAGVPRMIAQSIAWLYADGPEPHGESDALDGSATGSRAISLRGVLDLERLTLGYSVDSVVLRYGHLYGPGTGTADAPPAPALHVKAAALAAVRALQRGRGVYNIAERCAYLRIERALAELEFDPSFRQSP